MKRSVAILSIVIVLLVLLTSCGDPPASSEKTTDPSQYLHTNTYVREKLETFSPLVLPATISENASVSEYCYAYDCALMGMPNFSVKLILQYQNCDEYHMEQARIEALSDANATVNLTESGTRYYFGTTLDGLEMLTDARIEDGNCARLQFVFFEDATQTVTYAVGMVYDGSTHGGDIVEIGVAAMP